MQLRRLDDYQSWQISHQGSVILIDPWLTSEPITGSFSREHTPGFRTVDEVTATSEVLVAVLLCTSVSDHTRPQSLRALAVTQSTAEVLGPKAAVRIARRSGLSQGIPVRPGDQRQWRTREGGWLRVTVTKAGLPLGLIAVGYLVEAFEAPGLDVERPDRSGPDEVGALRGRVWIEPHQPTERVAARLAPVDIAILPCESVTAMVMPVTAGPTATGRAVRAARARMVVPTATDPRRDMTTWQRLAYRVAGGEQDLTTILGAGTIMRSMSAGEVEELGPAGRGSGGGVA